MPLINLGTQSLVYGVDFIPFSPVELDNDKGYFLYALITSSMNQDILGSVVIDYSFVSKKGYSATYFELARIYFKDSLQGIPVILSKVVDKDFDIVFRAKRLSFYSGRTMLPDISLQLQIDPDESF